MERSPIVLPTTPRKIIRAIVCTPPTPEVGKSVLVEVKSPDGKPYTDNDPVHISINGTPGARQWLQWAKPGNKAVCVMAKHMGIRTERAQSVIEHEVIKVKVQKPKHGQTAPPILRIIRHIDQPYHVSFRLDGWQPKRFWHECH